MGMYLAYPNTGQALQAAACIGIQGDERAFEE